MYRVDQVYALYNLGGRLFLLSDRLDDKHQLRHVAQLCTTIKTMLSNLLLDEILPVERCKDSAARLLKAIREMTTGPELKANWGKPLNPYFLGPIRDALNEFQVDLANELEKMPLYYTTAKRGYSVNLLVDQAEKVLSAAEIEYLSQLTINDIREAGGCLMFDRFTAAGFHATRAVEAVARPYYTLMSGREPFNRKGQTLNLGTLVDYLQSRLNELKTAKQSTGLLGVVVPSLDRIREIYRNPIMHPEMTLQEDDAIDVFDLVKSAITHMTKDVRNGGAHFKISLAELSAFRFGS